MLKTSCLSGMIVLSLCLTASGQDYPSDRSERFRVSSGFQLGYLGGTGGQMSTTISDFVVGLPVAARLGVGHARVEPGKATDARRIFINDATNGVPEERGGRWDVSFDAIVPVSEARTRSTYVFFGPRYVMHKSNFKYVGGNEDFDVTSNHWGVGAGLETHFLINPRLDLVIGGGVDHYFQSTLYGHDTSYNPNGETVNRRHEYTFDDADDAISQPKLEPRVVLGIGYQFR